MEAKIAGRIESVNVGRPRAVTWQGRRIRSGIWKEPVDRRVRVDGTQVDGDQQADRRVHGGPDKAVYAYAIEDYHWWSDVLGRPVEWATFGENLTTSGLDLMRCVIGERWRIGDRGLVLEVAEPRFPCFKLGIRMDDDDFVEVFERAQRLGAYLRIIDPGDVGTTDVIDVIRRPSHHATLLDFAAAVAGDVATMQRLVEVVDIAPRWRERWARTIDQT